MRVTAIVVTWDSSSDIGACLASLDAQEQVELDVIVLDNASRDDTSAIVDRHIAAGPTHPTELVRFEHNLGFCGAVNRGISRSTADAVLLVNPDTQLEATCTARLVDVLDAHPSCGSVQPKLLRPRAVGADAAAPDVIDTTGHVLTRPRLVLNRGAGQADLGQFDEAGEVFGASGACVLHRRTMLDDIARDDATSGSIAGEVPTGEPERLTEDLVAYFDDVELDLRARMRGWSARYEPSARVRHARAGASRRRRRRVRVLNLSNHALVIVGTEGPRSLLTDAAVVVPVWMLRLVVATLRSPFAMVLALGRLRLLPGAVRRGRRDRARALLPLPEVIERWAQPLPAGWLLDAARRSVR
jgi:GT2 family glycosyltransferase